MTDPTVKPRRRIARRRLLALAILAGGLLLLEAGTRVVLWARGRPYNSAGTEEKLRNMLSPIRAFLPTVDLDSLPDGARRPILHPYYGSEDEHDTGGVLAHFRERAKPEDYEIVIVGGSVAALLAMKETSWIEQALGADPRLAGRHVVLLNAAHPAYKQPQQLNRITLLLTLGYVPEVVVSIDGFNEVTGALDNASETVNPVWPGAPIWSSSMSILTHSRGSIERAVELMEIRNQAYDTVNTSLDLGLHRSAVLGALAVSRLHALNRRRAVVQSSNVVDLDLDERIRHQIHGPEFEPGRDKVLAMGVRAWTEGSRSLRAVCESRGIRYLHVLQPTLWDTGAKPMSPEERAIEHPNDRWLVAVRDGYPLLRAEGLSLAGEGMHFVDASRAFADVRETLYFDPCHFGPEGNRILREIVVRHLLDDVLPR